MSENVVTIKGNQYKYTYVDGETKYLGPVGSAPAISEAEFMLYFRSTQQEIEELGIGIAEIWYMSLIGREQDEVMEKQVRDDLKKIRFGKWDSLDVFGSEEGNAKSGYDEEFGYHVLLSKSDSDFDAVIMDSSHMFNSYFHKFFDEPYRPEFLTQQVEDFKSLKDEPNMIISAINTGEPSGRKMLDYLQKHQKSGVIIEYHSGRDFWFITKITRAR